jgi:hypothetical protein
MNCFLDCLRQRLGLILFAALIGAVIGGMGGILLGCSLAGGTLGAAGGPGGSIGLTIICSGVSLIALLPYVIVAALIGALIVGSVATLFVVAMCGMACGGTAVNAGASGVLPIPGSLMPNEPLDCTAANAAVSELEKLLADARTARDAQQIIVDQRQGAFNAARNVWLAALAVLAATSIWNPVAMALALLAVAVASGALAVTLARLVAEQVKLAELNARVVALESALAMATATRENLCGSSVDTGGVIGEGAPHIVRPPAVGGGLLDG